MRKGIASGNLCDGTKGWRLVFHIALTTTRWRQKRRSQKKLRIERSIFFSSQKKGHSDFASYRVSKFLKAYVNHNRFKKRCGQKFAADNLLLEADLLVGWVFHIGADLVFRKGWMTGTTPVRCCLLK